MADNQHDSPSSPQSRLSLPGIQEQQSKLGTQKHTHHLKDSVVEMLRACDESDQEIATRRRRWEEEHKVKDSSKEVRLEAPQDSAKPHDSRQATQEETWKDLAGSSLPRIGNMPPPTTDLLSLPPSSDTAKAATQAERPRKIRERSDDEEEQHDRKRLASGSVIDRTPSLWSTTARSIVSLYQDQMIDIARHANASASKSQRRIGSLNPVAQDQSSSVRSTRRKHSRHLAGSSDGIQYAPPTGHLTISDFYALPDVSAFARHSSTSLNDLATLGMNVTRTHPVAAFPPAGLQPVVQTNPHGPAPDPFGRSFRRLPDEYPWETMEPPTAEAAMTALEVASFLTKASSAIPRSTTPLSEKSTDTLVDESLSQGFLTSNQDEMAKHGVAVRDFAIMQSNG